LSTGRYARDDPEFDAKLEAWVKRREAYFRANAREILEDNREWQAWLDGHPRFPARSRVETRSEAYVVPTSEAKTRSSAIREYLEARPYQHFTARVLASVHECNPSQARRSLAWLKRQGFVKSSSRGWTIRLPNDATLGTLE